MRIDRKSDVRASVRAFVARLAAWAVLLVAVAPIADAMAQSSPQPASHVLSVKQVPIPEFPGANAIWGATGQDRRGRVWFGVSVEGGDGSARLFEYDPSTGAVIDRGGVVEALKRLDLYRPGETQVKIHSKLWHVGEHLYFSSTDDAFVGPVENTSALRWGSHLWRLRLSDHAWEHLLAVPEGLTAVTAGGRWIYALGHWDHVLYQYDTRTGDVRRAVVGAVPGHMSRNLVADARGHVYVPRIVAAPPKSTREDPFGTSALRMTLVEFDTKLVEVAETPLRGYANVRDPANSHGIIGYAALPDGSIAISLHLGALYRIRPGDGQPAEIEDLGSFHPLGPAYAPSLFVVEEGRALAGVARPPRGGFVWLVRDVEQKLSRPAQEFPFASRELLLYGSATRDREGDFYVAGRYLDAAGRTRPLLLRVRQR